MCCNILLCAFLWECGQKNSVWNSTSGLTIFTSIQFNSFFICIAPNHIHRCLWALEQINWEKIEERTNWPPKQAMCNRYLEKLPCGNTPGSRLKTAILRLTGILHKSITETALEKVAFRRNHIKKNSWLHGYAGSTETDYVVPLPGLLQQPS